MTKAETLSHWRNLDEGANPLAHMTPLAYKAKGSTYGACGIRIDGNPEFVDAVLACLKALIPGENTVTRLGLSRAPVKGENLGKNFANKESGAEVCYIRLHMRGNESSEAFFPSAETSQATRDFAQALGVE